jgi:hypothetical protein
MAALTEISRERGFRVSEALMSFAPMSWVGAAQIRPVPRSVRDKRFPIVDRDAKYSATFRQALECWSTPYANTSIIVTESEITRASAIGSSR